ncbi:hypothetical protein JCM18899A_19440 [Nocardioides sp. AN3]
MAGGILARARRRLRKGEPTEDERRLLASPLFDEEWYSAQVGRPLDRRTAVRHYLDVGVAAGHHPHPLFDPDYVRSQWGPARLRRLGAGDPLGLYLRRETYRASTHVLFDTARYVGLAPEAATYPGGPTAHYVEVGAAAGLTANDWLDGDLRDWLRERRTAVVGAAAGDEPGAAAGDEPGAAGESGAAEESLVSVIVVASGDAGGATAAVESAMAHGAAERHRVECVVWDDGSRAEVAAALEALPLRFPGVQVIHGGSMRGPAYATNRALARACGATVVLLGDDVALPPGWLEPLLEPLADPAVLGAQAVLISADRLIRSAGYAFPPGGLPHDFLRGFPLDDAMRIGPLSFAAVSTAAIAVRRTQLLEVGGLDESLGGPGGAAGDGARAGRGEGLVQDLDLCRRLVERHGGHFRVVAEAAALRRERPGDEATSEADRTRILADGDAGARGDDVALWAAAGFRVVDRDIRGPRADESLAPRLRVPQPLLVREARFHTRPGPLRWAIKNPTPAHSTAWGDIHFVDGLAEALRSLGQQVVVDRAETWERPTVRHDDVAVLIRGPLAARPTPEHPTLAWVISHPDTVTAEELQGYDAVFAASASWAGRRSAEWGIAIQPLLQATDPDRFGPDSADPDSGAEVLFVGSTRGEFRPIVRDALAADLDLEIYGVGWEEFLRPDQVAGRYLDNTRVSAAYRSAGVVLNDHFEDMRREGFLSNRLFDAVASGARVVSDEVAGLNETFGGAVQVYRTPEDLRRLVARRHEVFADEATRVAVAERVRREHSFRARAEVLLSAAHEAVGRRPW